MNIAYILASVLVLTACGKGTTENPKEKIVTDQCLRAELFKGCLSNIPKGPEKIDNSNDWDEVVESCERHAYRASQKISVYVEPSCRSH